ncbi:MAG: hypothetical protein M0D53_00665 [Flavobacterium sp. JAD_PAG50586_2]|nr:MAG: hypothetical protein M0D53_00665 [Flavobacterium sp. JAD_PAG50586_2]
MRAVLLFVSNHSTTLELKIPSLFVALENITKVLTGGDSSVPKLIENEKIIAELNLTIKSTVKEINKIKNTNKPNSSSQELKEYNSNFDRIANKMHMLNNGTNNKKLIDPFVNLGYVLTAEEEEIILRYRNKFLHGEDYMSLDIDYEIEFRELFHMSMKLHKLISILLLKASGYSGYILNNAKIYDYISEKNIKEPIFIKI